MYSKFLAILKLMYVGSILPRPNQDFFFQMQHFAFHLR